MTKIFHPNIDPETGDIELDILFDKWKPQMTILSVLSALQALLLKPEPMSYYKDVSEANIMHKKDFFEFKRKAQLWTQIYA